MEKVDKTDFSVYMDAKRKEAMKVADVEEAFKERLKRKAIKAEEKRIEEDTERFYEELRRKVYPKMQGYLGIWDKETPPTPHGKQNFLYIVASRQAKLQAQTRWLKAEQERNREKQLEIEREKAKMLECAG